MATKCRFIAEPKTAAPRPGVDKGPIHLVEAGLVKQITDLGWRVKFDGHHQFEDVDAASDPPVGILKNPRLVSRVTEAVAEAVGQHARNGELTVTLGGDHSLVRPRSSIMTCKSHWSSRHWAPCREH
ncbi:hypothetical protein H2248_009303 [Termitomyces sp. 'cryptogamus']|nr:hypothetical protein H2248_009303 [Termitomyces sp. 'cryptogamus']